MIYLPKGQPEQAKEYFLKSVKYKIKNFIYFQLVFMKIIIVTHIKLIY